MTKKETALAKKFAQTIAKEHGFNFKQTEMVLLETGGADNEDGYTFDYVMFGFTGDSPSFGLEYQVYLYADGTSSFKQCETYTPALDGQQTLETAENDGQKTADTLSLSQDEKQALTSAILPPLELSLAAFNASGFEGSFNDWFSSLSLDDMLEIGKQKTVEVLSPSNTALVVDGVMVAAPTVTDLNTATLYIKREIAGVANSFCRIGFKLYEINKNRLFEAVNLKNISEYGEQYLGFKKSSTANYISICKRFSVKDENGEPTSVLSQSFEAFSYTQLSEMLAIPAEKLEDISPDMTVKEIRSAKSTCENPNNSAEETEENAGLYAVSIFDRKLTEKNIDLVIELLRENIGKDIQITTF